MRELAGGGQSGWQRVRVRCGDGDRGRSGAENSRGGGLLEIASKRGRSTGEGGHGR